MSIDDAIEAAEREASDYPEQHGFTFIELSQAFWMFSDLQGDGVELFSLLRENDYEPSAYLDHFTIRALNENRNKPNTSWVATADNVPRSLHSVCLAPPCHHI